MKKIILIIIIGIIITIAFQIGMSAFLSTYIGTDDRAIELVENIAPQYTPWFDFIFEFDGDNAETIMFVIQSIIGVLLISSFVIYNERRLKKKHKIINHKII